MDNRPSEMPPGSSVKNRLGSLVHASFRTLRVGLLALIAIWTSSTGPVVKAWAQGGTGSAEARSAQFVFVIDDSGSMAKKMADGPAADPNRLAIFAVRSLIEMLDDSDEVSVVRLNGPIEGDAPPPLQPLGQNRDRLRELLADKGPLARYAGSYTPCRSALEEVAELLNGAYRPNVSQVVILLTDGKCTTPDGSPPQDQVREIADHIRSHSDGLLRFYLLRFRGRPHSPQLTGLAQATQGQALEVSAEDPTDMLEPFADALTRSQGYEAELLTPHRTEIASHYGAKRIRLLVVAPDDGPELGIELFGRRGDRLPPTERIRRGLHHYPGGKAFRYAALDYRPTRSPVTVQVSGAGAGWKAVVVPEYRLFVQMAIHRGDCSSPGEILTGGVETGTTVCAILSLVNEGGQSVELSATGDEIQAYVDWGPLGGQLDPHHANRTGESLRYSFERRTLPRGDWVFQPRVTLRIGGQEVVLQGAPQQIQASSIEILAVPRDFELGTLRPGEESKPRTVVFQGEFPPTNARLEVTDRQSLPACVTFWLNGEPEGTPVPILPAPQAYSLSARVQPYCGPDNLNGTFSPTLRLVFDVATSGETLPPVPLSALFHLVYALELPREIQIEIKAGESAEVDLPLRSNATRPMELLAMLEEPRERESWPGDDLDLTLVDLTGDRGGSRSSESSPRGLAAAFDPSAPESSPLGLRLTSEACCAAGTYTTRLGLTPASAEGYAPGLALPDPVFVPVHVSVAGSGLWACRGSLILRTLLLLLLVLLIFYLVSMVRHSRFITPNVLVDHMVPLVWNSFGGATSNPKRKLEVRAMVKRGMSLPRRIEAWLKSNPLIFGLPGRTYNETVELNLQPERGVAKSRVSLIMDREHYQRLQQDPGPQVGKLFARAQARGSLMFFAVPRSDHRIGRLVPERLQYESPSEDNPKPKLLRLRRREKLIHHIPEEEREEGRPAGWQVG